MLLCLIGYTIKSIKDYKRDVSRKESIDYYINKLTWGTILLRLIVSVLPLLNILALTIDLLRDWLEKWWDVIGKFLSRPIVKR